VPHVLVVDDDPDAVEWMTEVARGQGCTVAPAASLGEARAQLALLAADVVVSDLQLPDGRGIELVGDIDRGSTEFVLVTGHASVESAIDALRAGATDYLVKPVEPERLEAILRRVPRREDLQQEIGSLREELRRLGRFGRILGESPPMQRLYDQLARVAPTSATVLLIGESGTGKELAAQTVHDLSRRRRKAFLAVNCGAISPQLVESELFGHEKGSFTGADRQHVGLFERADGGSLFLDEISEMNEELQVKLLRVLESGQFMRVGSNDARTADVRVIAATNRNLRDAIERGTFREDLYYRLQVFEIRLPPLRERPEDILPLSEAFLADLSHSFARPPAGISREARELLVAYAWPGNVRELRNILERAAILCEGALINAEHLTLPAPRVAAMPRAGETDVAAAPVAAAPSETDLKSVERVMVEKALKDARYNKAKAARALGLTRTQLYVRLRRYGLE
jgi:two-component system response regulator AtoC